MNNKIKRTKTYIKESVENGRVIDTTVTQEYKTAVNTDNFFMVFFENMGSFLGLKRMSDARLIACMCKLADFDTGRVLLTKEIREQLCKDCQVQYSNLSRSLTRLVSAGLLTGGKGTYTINPNIFWKGTTKSRTEILKTGGLTFKVTFVDPSKYMNDEEN